MRWHHRPSATQKWVGWIEVGWVSFGHTHCDVQPVLRGWRLEPVICTRRQCNMHQKIKLLLTGFIRRIRQRDAKPSEMELALRLGWLGHGDNLYLAIGLASQL